jgi:hypothetical protein
LYPKEISLFLLILILLPILLITTTIVPQEKLSLLIAQGQEGENNTSATGMENIRKRIVPEAEEVNEANSELI